MADDAPSSESEMGSHEELQTPFNPLTFYDSTQI